MQSFRSLALWATLLAPAAVFAQDVTTSGTLSLAVGTALQSGSRPAFQQTTQHSKLGYFGIEDYNLTREAKDSTLTFNARILPGDEDYRVNVRFEKSEHYYVDAGYQQYRVYYNGFGGYFAPKNLSLSLYDENLSVDRSKSWLELGAYTANQTLFRLRWERLSRSGTKDTTIQGDTSWVGSPYGTRNIVPSFYDLKEITNTVTFDVGNQSQDSQKWNVGARYSETRLDDRRNVRRRPFESVDRIFTQKDDSKNDIFAVHGYYLRNVSEQLTVSGGALITQLDTVIEGSRIYGQGYDPIFDPAAIRRQTRDEGFLDLEGKSNVNQTVLNLNAVYEPRKNWSIRPSIRFENRTEDTTSTFIETNVGNAPALVTAMEDLEAENNKDWNEFAESVEVRYTGKPNWTFNAKADLTQGTGNLEEQLGEGAVLSIDRDNDIERYTQKYSASANWYAKPGLTFAAQYYYKVNQNDYNVIHDNTPPYGGDRYPLYIIDQDFETHDMNVRMSWRPVSQLGLVTRYDHQISKITSVEAGLGKANSADYQSDIISQSVSWSPTARLYLNGSVNVTFDQLKTPAYPKFIQNADNNYINGSVGGGYVVSQKDDVYFDHSWFNASNFIPEYAGGVPYGLSQNLQASYLTWVRRQTEALIYTVRYGYVTNHDTTFGGRKDFDAHVLYAKVQYRF